MALTKRTLAPQIPHHSVPVSELELNSSDQCGHPIGPLNVNTSNIVVLQHLIFQPIISWGGQEGDEVSDVPVVHVDIVCRDLKPHHRMAGGYQNSHFDSRYCFPRATRALRFFWNSEGLTDRVWDISLTLSRCMMASKVGISSGR